MINYLHTRNGSNDTAGTVTLSVLSIWSQIKCGNSLNVHTDDVTSTGADAFET